MFIEVKSVLAIGGRVSLLSEQFYFNISGTVKEYAPTKFL
jgi:hypothetical protein